MPDTWLGAIQLTALDLIVVFFVLWLLAVVIKGTQAAVARADRASSKGDHADDEETTEVAPLASDSFEIARPVVIPTVGGSSPDMDITTDDPRLVAVITAAVSSYMGEEAVPFAVKSITPVDGVTTEAWLLAGRQRLMQLRSMPAQRR